MAKKTKKSFISPFSRVSASLPEKEEISEPVGIEESPLSSLPVSKGKAKILRKSKKVTKKLKKKKTSKSPRSWDEILNTPKEVKPKK